MHRCDDRPVPAVRAPAALPASHSDENREHVRTASVDELLRPKGVTS